MVLWRVFNKDDAKPPHIFKQSLRLDWVCGVAEHCVQTLLGEGDHMCGSMIQLSATPPGRVRIGCQIIIYDFTSHVLPHNFPDCNPTDCYVRDGVDITDPSLDFVENF